MARSIWNGTISFALVNVPIKLYSATESKSVHFHRVHLKDGARIRHKRFCSKEGREVPYEEVVKGYEVAEDTYVVLEKEEIKAAAGDRGKVIEIEEFVDAGEIDPVFFERTYYVGSREDENAYRLLHDALRKTGRAGIGRFSYHDREYLAAIRALDGVIALHTLRFHDEVTSGEELDFASTGRAPSKREAKMASQLIESISDDFKPADCEDTYRESVLELIEAKAAGRSIEVEDDGEEREEDGDELLAALESSLAETRG